MSEFHLVMKDYPEYEGIVDRVSGCITDGVNTFTRLEIMEDFPKLSPLKRFIFK